MVEIRGSRYLVPFAQRYGESFPPLIKYPIDTDGNSIEGRSSVNFTKSREELMHSLFEGKSKHVEFTHSLLAESVVSMSLQPALGDEFKAVLAPQNLEWSRESKGVDILIADSNDLVYLGVDVKLRKGQSKFGRDGHGWSDQLKAPYIYLSLGNWTVDMKEREEVKVLDWLQHYTIPQIQRSGKITRIDDFRQYLLRRVEKSVSGYRESLREPDFYRHTSGRPESAADAKLLEEKLAVMQSLFTDLVTSL